jgi:hypothetical protein
MAVEDLITGALAGKTFRSERGPATGGENDRIDAQVGLGNRVSLDGVANPTTDGSGDVDIDLTARFSAIKCAFITFQGAPGTQYSYTRDLTATAGHLKIRITDLAGTPVTSTAVNFEWFVVGTPA